LNLKLLEAVGSPQRQSNVAREREDNDQIPGFEVVCTPCRTGGVEPAIAIKGKGARVT